ncbi:DinB family protein [Armatimonas sp.]|uniref:DinB family protein n=1 Tax=Armatimonas sp. TaxID=1872638 RepID=UPI00286BE490|nr:DinB family protein [Armatimonas sp.]
MSLSNGLAAQAERQWTMFRMTIGRLTDEQWYAGEHPGLVPARIAFHALQWADFYIQSDPSAFDTKARFGVDANDDPATLPSRAALRTYLDDIAARTDTHLRSLDDAALLEEETLFPWCGAIVMERVLYTFRHTTYHLGELSYALRVHGAKATEWK